MTGEPALAASTGDPFLARWARRAVSIPGYFFAWTLVAVLSIPLLPALALLDLATDRRLPRVRALAMLNAYLLAEVIGMVASFVIWLTEGGWRRHPSARYLDRNFRLQGWWAKTLFRAATRIFSLRVDVTGDELLARGPLILFARHVSQVDNLIPAVYGSAKHGLRLRWVINRWLLRDPCLDIVGNRLPNAFVRGDSADGARYIRLVAALARGLGPKDGVLVYPEGALFNRMRRERLLQRLHASDTAEWERAEQLKNVLPPRPGGALALLAAAREADVVFCAHTGLESAGSYRAFLSGDLIGKTLRIRFWRIPHSELPPSFDSRKTWLWDEWGQVDRLVSSERGALEPAPGAAGR